MKTALHTKTFVPSNIAPPRGTLFVLITKDTTTAALKYFKNPNWSYSLSAWIKLDVRNLILTCVTTTADMKTARSSRTTIARGVIVIVLDLSNIGYVCREEEWVNFMGCCWLPEMNWRIINLSHVFIRYCVLSSSNNSESKFYGEIINNQLINLTQTVFPKSFA